MRVSLPVGFCGMVIGGRGLTVVTGGLTVEGLVVVGVRVLVDNTAFVVEDSDVTVGGFVVAGARVLLGGTPLAVVDSDVVGGIVGFTK